MSTRDGPSLSEQERAILEGLAAKAAADDPVLAAALAGRNRSLRVRVPRVPAWARSAWARSAWARSAQARSRWTPPAWAAHWLTGLGVALAGLALMLVALSVSVALGAVGAVLAFAGAHRVAAAAPWSPARRRGPSPD